MNKRTKKEFSDYNTYHDRPFGLKWGTAFAMDELVKGIEKNEHEALKENFRRPLMTREEIDTTLTEAFLYQEPLLIQLNLRDSFGRLLDDLEGFFLGEAYEDYFVFEDQKLLWEDVRHVQVISKKKWFLLENPLREQPMSPKKELSLIRDEFYQPFFELEIRETNQDL